MEIKAFNNSAFVCFSYTLFYMSFQIFSLFKNVLKFSDFFIHFLVQVFSVMWFKHIFSQSLAYLSFFFL